MGTVWVCAWLFTIGFLHLTFWKGVLAIVLWPYYLGVRFSPLPWKWLPSSAEEGQGVVGANVTVPVNHP